MNRRRSLVKARSLSLAGSILAKIGMLRRTSTSLVRLIRSVLLHSLGRNQLVQGAAILVELGPDALFDDAAALHDQNVIESLGPVAAAQRPDDRAAGKGLEHRVQHGALFVRVERADRVVGDQDVR